MLFVVIFSFAACVLTAYCAFSERNQGIRQFYAALAVLNAALAIINIARMVA